MEEKLIKLLEEIEDHLDKLEENDEIETKEYALTAWFRTEIDNILNDRF